VNEYHNNWDVYLPFALMAYRSAPHSSTGFSPHQLLYGYELRTPLDISIDTPWFLKSYDSNDYRYKLEKGLQVTLKETKRKIEAAQHKQKFYYDQKSTPVQIKEGDYVYIFTPQVPKHQSKKFFRKWTGPYKVIRQTSDVTFQLCLPNKQVHDIFHVNRLQKAPIIQETQKPMIPVQYDPNDPSIEEDDPNVEFEVEAIMGRRNYKGRLQYRVKWVGYDEQNWLPKENLKGCMNLVNNYEDEWQQKQRKRKR